MGKLGGFRRGALAAACLLAATSAGLAVEGAGASSAPDVGVAWEPPPPASATYGIKPPSADPAQVRIVPGHDGTPLYTQTWLPAAKDGHAPPERMPVVVVYTPYARVGAPDAPWVIDALVPRGYAVTFANVRGSGASGGCFGLIDQNEVLDGARIIEDAGELAPWASGSVGMIGASYPGGTQIQTATGPDRDRLESLKALVVIAPSASGYEVYNHDGVPHLLSSTASLATYIATLTNPTDDLSHITERLGCQVEQLISTLDISGSYSAFWRERDHTRHLDRLTAATLMVQGSADRRVSPQIMAGLFDGLPPTTPRAGLFGVWAHESPNAFAPDITSPRKDWERRDFGAMVVAWFERYLRDVPNGVEGWPVAQVQGTDGQWRTASEWPVVPGPEKTLRLGGGGRLGVGAASGSTTYLEAPLPELELDGSSSALPGTAAVFTTAPLTERLEIIGTPQLDLWVKLLLPDSHVTARLEAVDAAGNRVTPESRTMGARSAMHRQPIQGSRFRQANGTLAPILQPVKIALRFDPIDLVVPAGARLRLTVASSSIAFDGLDGVSRGLGFLFQGPTLPSGLVQPVTILHSAGHPSALRFTLPEAGSVTLDVREADQVGQPLGQSGTYVPVDGGL